MSWQLRPDQVYLINLKQRPQRKFESLTQLHKFKIPCTVISAIYDQDGANGIYETLLNLFKWALTMYDFEYITTFEDDLDIIDADIRLVMDLALSEAPADFDMIQLGANIPQPYYAHPFSPHLLQLDRSLSLHAVVWSRKCMEEILELPKKLPIDILIAENIHKNRKVFCTNPMLVSQRAGYSDIDKRLQNNKIFLEERFKKTLEFLKHESPITVPDKL